MPVNTRFAYGDDIATSHFPERLCLRAQVPHFSALSWLVYHNRARKAVLRERRAVHSTTSSVAVSSEGSTARPSVLAVYFFAKISSKKPCIAFQDR